MNEAINVQQADIHTATVDVAILRVSGKQVTLAVFRQLKEEPLIDSDGHFVGLPWGTVNYHPPKECSGPDGQHLHVVWQRGSDLRRAVATQPQSQTAWSDAADSWLIAASAKGWRPNESFLDKFADWGVRDPESIRVRFTAGTCVVDVPTDLGRFWGAEWNLTKRPDHAVATREHPAPPAESSEQLLAAAEAEVAAFYERQRQRHKRWEELHALPQLFIAV